MPVSALAPAHIKRLAAELRSLVAQPEDCVEALVNEGDIQDVQAVITGPAGTPYEGGRFHLHLTIGEGYPDQPPQARFATRVFHPNVSAKGDICVNILKRDWTPATSLRQICQFIKCLLIEPFPDSALNEEAAQMLHEDYGLFFATARASTKAYAQPQAQPCERGGSSPLQLQSRSQNSENIRAN